MNGHLIVLEGLDGSGKATQAGLLAQALEQQGLPVRKISFPNYESPACEPVKMYLAGKFGQKPGDVNAYAASTFYAVDRYASFQQDWRAYYEAGGVVIADRYTTSNGIHQCSKLPREEWDAYLDWLFEFEYEKLGIPEPEQVIYLQVDPQVSQKLMTGRYQGDETRKDIHERDVEYLKASRRAAEYCADRFQWKRVRCDENGTMRSIEDIHKEILALVLKHRGESGRYQ